MRVPAAILAMLITGAANAAAEPGSAVETVERLYHDYAWEAVVQGPRAEQLRLMEAPLETLRRYFTGSLATLLVKDRECAARTKEICRLDFEPIWGSQDPATTELSIVPGRDPSSVRVSFSYPGQAQRIELTYTLVNEPAGWRISNITGSDWNLRNILEGQR